MNAKQISRALEEIATLLELKEENPFKVKAHKTAAQIVERLEINALTIAKIKNGGIKGIGTNTASVISELFETGESSFLNELSSEFDESFLELLKIKGLGAKKVKILKKELGINSIEDLEKACAKDKLIKLKGFAQKTQESILKSIEFYKSVKGFFYYKTASNYLNEVLNKLANSKYCLDFIIAGDFRMNEPLIKELEVIIETNDTKKLSEDLGNLSDLKEIKENKDKIDITFKNKLPLHLKISKKKELSEAKEYFEKNYSFANTVEVSDIKGIIHAHSTYSDGINTLKDLALAIKSKGYQYLAISDHSQSAFYASGLKERDIKRQHEEIDRLNEELAPFVIFKGIESDILKDGSLDYPDKVLESFDFIIASVHSNFELSSDEMNKRIVRAIENPYTNILGHPTGRLLLKRPAYQLEMNQILEAAAKNKVAIEINSNPARLDLDWKYQRKAVELGIKLGICPDAHSIEEIDNIKWGVAVAKKAGIRKEDLFSCLGVDELRRFFEHG